MTGRVAGRGLVVAVTDDRGRPRPARGLASWLARAAPRWAAGEVGVALVSDAVIRRLNRRFRRVDRPTDVLAFPAAPVARGKAGRGARRLGDIAIALGVARRQARRHGHAEAAEWRILALHGLLHLLGYDHDTDQGEMTRLEERLRRRAGLPAGLGTRLGRGRRPGGR